MESLLRWSIANSAPREDGQSAPQPRTDLDPAIIDAILGKSDAELMKESLTVAVDERRDEDDRIQALDNFEMLVEQIDNANNLEKLKMWEPLHALLTNPSSSEEIQMQTLWILGTAVQNNPAAQTSYLALSPLRTLLSFLSPTVRSGKTRAKAVYALSGLLKHNSAAVSQMADAGGWAVLRDALQDSDISVRRKVAFLLNTLLIPTQPVASTSRERENGSEGRGQEGPANTQQQLQVSTSTSAVTAATASQTQSLTLHPSFASSQSEPAAPPQTVHPNSHASMVSDPSSYSTSSHTVRALESNGLLSTLISSLAFPVPHGPNGESEGDADFEEKVLRALHTYSVGCQRQIQGDDRRTLGKWLDEQNSKSGGNEGLAERWNLTGQEVRELRAATA